MPFLKFKKKLLTILKCMPSNYNLYNINPQKIRIQKYRFVTEILRMERDFSKEHDKVY